MLNLEELQKTLRKAKRARADRSTIKTVSGKAIHVLYVGEEDEAITDFFANSPSTIEALVEKLGTLQRRLDDIQKGRGTR